MTRLFDISFSFLGLIFLSPILLCVYLIGCMDTGSPVFCQERLGRKKRIFRIYKFRTMYKNSPSIATHLAVESSITPIGKYLRKYKLDELPQLWNVLIGDMSLVGPRPNLPNQSELINFRDALGVYRVRPGVTGLAQLRKIDMSRPKTLAIIDAKMINNLSELVYFKYILLTLCGIGFGDRIGKG